MAFSTPEVLHFLLPLKSCTTFFKCSLFVFVFRFVSGDFWQHTTRKTNLEFGATLSTLATWTVLTTTTASTTTTATASTTTMMTTSVAGIPKNIEIFWQTNSLWLKCEHLTSRHRCGDSSEVVVLINKTVSNKYFEVLLNLRIPFV